MADPLSCLGAAASVAGIIDILSRSIGMISQLSDHWKDADLLFASIKTQLQVLRSALAEVKSWAESVGAEEAYHQLTMDLDSVLSCCRSLASRINDHLLSLPRGSTGQLNKLGKLKLVLGGRNLDDIQKMIERQISTLTLLLTACRR